MSQEKTDWTRPELLELYEGAQELYAQQLEIEKKAFQAFTDARTYVERLTSEARRMRNLERDSQRNHDIAQNSKEEADRRMRIDQGKGLPTYEIHGDVRRLEGIQEQSGVDARRYGEQANVKERQARLASEELRAKREAYSAAHQERLKLAQRIQMLKDLIDRSASRQRQQES